MSSSEQKDLIEFIKEYDSNKETIKHQNYVAKTFTNIYSSFEIWCDNQGINSKKYPKSDIKKELEKLQEKTEYGLVLGKKIADNCPNGSRRYPRFNFKPIEFKFPSAKLFVTLPKPA